MVGRRHPAAAAGTPMCGRDPSARSAGDKRQRREGKLQVGFGQIYAPFLARYTPRFWLKYTPKRRFWKTRRLLRGVFLRASITRRIFLWIRAVQRPAAPASSAGRSTPGAAPGAKSPAPKNKSPSYIYKYMQPVLKYLYVTSWS